MYGYQKFTSVMNDNVSTYHFLIIVDAEINFNVLLSVIGAVLGCVVIAVSAFYVFWCHKKGMSYYHV